MIDTTERRRFKSLIDRKSWLAWRADPILIQQATASPAFASVTGRVLTPDGRALRNAVVTIIDTAGIRQSATTSSFGLFSFDNDVSGQQYIFSIQSKRFRYAPAMVTINATLTLPDFVGLE